MPKSWDLQSIIYNAQQVVQAGRGIGRFSFSVKAYWPAPLNSVVEAVEKVPKQILGRDVEKNDLLECATINDFMLGKGQVTPENIVLTRQKDFSYRLVRRQSLERAYQCLLPNFKQKYFAVRPRQRSTACIGRGSNGT